MALSEVVVGYEEALEALGFHPGLVEVSTLALSSLGEAETEEGDRLLVNWDEGYVSFLLLRGPSAPAGPHAARGDRARIASPDRRRAPSSSTGSGSPGTSLTDVVLRSAAVPPDEAVAALGPVLGRGPRVLQPWAALGRCESDLAAQAVAGAAASALRRVA